MDQRHLLSFVLCGFLLLSLVVGGPLFAQGLSPESLLDQAYNQFWDGRYDRAESTFRILTERFPDSSPYWDARYGLARSLRRKGELETAVRHFRSVRRNHPEKSVRGDALFGEVEVAILQDRTIRAERLLRTFLNVFPDHVLEPTAREQLELLQDLDRSGSSTPTASTSTPRSQKPEQPRLKPSGKGDTSARNLIEPDPSRSDPSGTSPNDPSVRSDASPGPSQEIVSKPGNDTSGAVTSPDRIRPPGSSRSGLAGETPSDTRSEATDQKPDAMPPADTSSGSVAASGEADLITPDELARASSHSMDTPMESTRTDTSREQPGDTKDQAEKKATANGTSVDTEPVNSGSVQGEETREPEGDADSGETTEQSLDRVRKLMRRNSLNEARALIDTVLDSENPGVEAYALGARLYDRDPARPNRVLEYVDRALRMSSDPPSEYHFLKTESLLASDRVQKALAALKAVNPESLGETQAGARYHYLRGTIALRLDQPDEAFFYFMDAVHSAPSSRWAKQSRQTIQDRL